MSNDERKKLAELFERADLVMLVFGERKAALGLDMVEEVVRSLKADAHDQVD